MSKTKTEKKETKEKKRKNKNESASTIDHLISNIAAPPSPSEEEIRIKAQEIFNYRIEFGINGSAEEDWHDAENCLNKKL